MLSYMSVFPTISVPEIHKYRKTDKAMKVV